MQVLIVNQWRRIEVCMCGRRCCCLATFSMYEKHLNKKAAELLGTVICHMRHAENKRKRHKIYYNHYYV